MWSARGEIKELVLGPEVKIEALWSVTYQNCPFWPKRKISSKARYKI